MNEVYTDLENRGYPLESYSFIIEDYSKEYFTPSLEDIRVGYELEHQFPDGWRPIKVEIDSRLKAWEDYIQEGRLRVPYLTKEQIEAEGWWHQYDDFSFGVFYRNKEEKKQYRLDFDYKSRHLCIQVVDDKNMITYGDIFSGECKDINTFRYICKLLHI